MAVSQKLTLLQVSQNTDNDTSQVRILWESTQTGGSYNETRRTAYYWVSMNGGPETKYSVSYILPYQCTHAVVDTTLTVPHDEEGNAYVQVRTWMNTNISAGVITLQESISLDPISQESTISTDASNYDTFIGMAFYVDIHSKNSQYTHTIQYVFGSQNGYLTEDGAISSEPVPLSSLKVLFDTPLDFYSEIPNSLSGQCRLICTTFLDGQQVGEPTEISFSLYADEQQCGPEVLGSVYDINELTNRLTGGDRIFIRYHSVAQCTIFPQPAYYADISKAWINGQEVSGNTLEIPNVQQETVVFLAEDTRGLKASFEDEIYLIPYTHLTGGASVERTDPTSGNALLSVSGSCYEGNFGAYDNDLTIQYQIDSGDFQNVTEIAREEGKYSARASLSGLDYRKVFSITVRISDQLETVEKKLTLKKGIPVFDWGEDDFVFHVPVQMDSDLNVGGQLIMGGKSLLDIFYPVGSVYSTASDSMPAELFGGTWELMDTDSTENKWKRTQ